MNSSIIQINLDTRFVELIPIFYRFNLIMGRKVFSTKNNQYNIFWFEKKRKDFKWAFICVELDNEYWMSVASFVSNRKKEQIDRNCGHFGVRVLKNLVKHADILHSSI